MLKNMDNSLDKNTPQGTRRIKQEDIESFVENWLHSKMVRSYNAWKVVYELLWWCVDIDGQTVPHIVEINMLKKSKSWLDRALKAKRYLSKEMGVQYDQLCDRLDMLMKGLGIMGRQRHNYLGRGFSATIKSLLLFISNLNAEKEASYALIPGLKDIGRGKVDISIPPPPDTRIIISTKWSLRHDRLKDLLNEASECKRRRADIKFLVVTNEFIPSRIKHLAEHPNIDGVYHVHRMLIEEVELTPPSQLRDFNELFDDVAY